MITKTTIPFPAGQGPQTTVPAQPLPWGGGALGGVAGGLQPPQPKAK